MSASPSPSAPKPYELLGGESGVRRLVDRFYDLMDSAPDDLRDHLRQRLHSLADHMRNRAE